MKEAGVWVRYKKKYKASTDSDYKKPKTRAGELA
jgi:putative transposase